MKNYKKSKSIKKNYNKKRKYLKGKKTRKYKGGVFNPLNLIKRNDAKIMPENLPISSNTSFYSTIYSAPISSSPSISTPNLEDDLKICNVISNYSNKASNPEQTLFTSMPSFTLNDNIKQPEALNQSNRNIRLRVRSPSPFPNRKTK